MCALPDATLVIVPLMMGLGIGLAHCISMFPQAWDGSLLQLFTMGSSTPRDANMVEQRLAPLCKQLNHGLCCMMVPLHLQFHELLHLLHPQFPIKLTVECSFMAAADNYFTQSKGWKLLWSV